MNTLKGVFGETKPKYKRNFIQENMRQLREMQGYWQNKEQQINLAVIKPKSKYQNVPSRVGSRTSGSQSRNAEHSSKEKLTTISKSPSKSIISNSTNTVSHVTQIGITRKSKTPSQKIGINKKGVREKDGDENISATDLSPINGERTSRSLGCQTIDAKNLNDLCEGVIRYPSSRKLPAPSKKQPVKKAPTREKGLQTDRSLSPEVTVNSPAAGDTPRSNNSNELDLQKLSLSQRSSEIDEPTEVPDVKSTKNTRDANPRSRTKTQNKSPLKIPSTYQRGVVPKYLEERKEEWKKAEEQKIQDAPDPSCPPGYVSFPDNKRIDALKKLRENYAELVQELNMMPVRTDTLRMRKRKMELEKELNKIEQVMKVFSRPKVYVKIGD
ncbi:hypothetical protein L9F63_001474 [Diploptera punctata]|uniref:Enkurin domain-containing protein n=1 Tax=Diploptera punctata TaxID=6984 RepID=A0AAD8A570_DIPPU|nr:hypothetical protein L9F63_001474 [Diploptera punctata]